MYIVSNPLEAQARWVEHLFTARRMMYTGVVMIDLSLGFLLYLPFSGEKLGVYLMSFLALLFSGIICVAEAAREKSS